MQSVVGGGFGLGLGEERVAVEGRVPGKGTRRDEGEGGSGSVGDLGRRGEKRSLAIGRQGLARLYYIVGSCRRVEESSRCSRM